MNQTATWEIDKFSRCPKCSSFLAYIVQQNLSVKMFCMHCNHIEVRSQNVKYLVNNWVESGKKIPGQAVENERFRDWVHRNRFPNE